jgi:hypothetical protein
MPQCQSGLAAFSVLVCGDFVTPGVRSRTVEETTDVVSAAAPSAAAATKARVLYLMIFPETRRCLRLALPPEALNNGAQRHTPNSVIETGNRKALDQVSRAQCRLSKVIGPLGGDVPRRGMALVKEEGVTAPTER